jgi:hypothetical protein
MQVSLHTMTSPQVMQGRRAADSAALLGLGAARLDSEFDSTEARRPIGCRGALQAIGHGPKGTPAVSITRRRTSTFYNDLLGKEGIGLAVQDQPSALAVRRMARDSRSTASGKF